MNLLHPVIRHYRQEQWRPLLDAVLALGIKCAFLLGDASEYAKMTLDLASPASSVAKEEKQRLMNNIAGLLGQKGKVPSAEPGTIRCFRPFIKEQLNSNSFHFNRSYEQV